jgi:hypothetical protein
MPEVRRSYVFWYAFGYFACYVPYSALAKALSSGALPGGKLAGTAMLPVSTIASSIAMVSVFTILGWWKHPGRSTLLGVRVPRPGPWTLLSGLGTAVIVVTTTLAYTFRGVSIPLVMLFMRGGVLLLAPVIDLISKRHVRWFSWVALVMSFLALMDAVFGKTSDLPFLLVINIVLYLAGYFVRLRFMSRLAKSNDKEQERRYFVEEQMVAAPAAVLMMFGKGPLADIRHGFTGIWSSPALPYLVVMGIFSQGTGFFGGLVLLDASENTFCVPLNRASSILAGLIAATFLSLMWGQALPTAPELIGASLLVGGIGVLWVGPRLAKWRAAANG